MITDLAFLKERNGGYVANGGRSYRGPGPGHSRFDNSLKVDIADSGKLLVHSFAEDPKALCCEHLGVSLGQLEPFDPREHERCRRERMAQQRTQRATDREFCERVWREALPVTGTLVETYHFERRLILESPDLRFHPAAPRSKSPGRTEPAQVALVRDARGYAMKLHVTYLQPNGRAKSSRPPARQMFAAGKGGAVRLREVGADGVLALAEGIETAASFDALTGTPTWAALSTSGIQEFELPAGLRRLIIAADSDDAGAGLRVATALADRARHRCRVEVQPAPSGKDWADVWMEARHV